jgi:hypothetical protein
MRRLLTLTLSTLVLAAAPVAAQDRPATPAPADPAAALAQLREAVRQLRAELFTPGELVAGWDRGGANPDAELRALGADTHYYRIVKPHSVAIVILTARPIAAFAPSGWRVADTYGSPVDHAENPVVQFETMSARYVVGLRAGSARRNDADCSDGIVNAVLYERPGAAASADDANVPIFFRLVLLATENQIVCTRYDGNRAAGWREHAFLPDGHRLPRMETEQNLITIVPAAPVEGLLQPR